MFKCKLFVLSLCLLVLPLCLNGQSQCTIQQLQGTYVSNNSGYVWNVPGTNAGFATVAANGDSIIEITNSNGLTTTVPGKWTVARDCTLSYVSHVESVEYKYTGVVLNNGAEIRLMQVQPLTMQIGNYNLPMTGTIVLYRLSAGPNTPGNCSANRLTGTFAQYCTGWKLITPGFPPVYAPTTMLGTISSTGDSTFSGSATMMTGGNLIPLVYKNASVTIDPKCTGTATFEFEGIPGTWTEKLVVFEQGKRMMSVTTSGQAVDVCHFTRMEK